MSEYTIPGTTPAIPTASQVEALKQLELQRFKHEYQSMDPFEIAMRSAIDPVFSKDIENLLADSDASLAKSEAKVAQIKHIAAQFTIAQVTPPTQG